MDREAVVIESLSKGFDGRQVLKDINLVVCEGECLVLLGSSGSGKTTLLRLIAGLDDADAGRIRINGALASAPHVVVRPDLRRVSMVFQDLALWPHITAVENVEFMVPRAVRGRKVRLEMAGRLLESVQIIGHQEKLPHQLSRGQQQRVALARALASEPSLLLLDEPFASQDQESKTQLVDLVRELRLSRGITTIYVTHTTEEIERIANRVAVLEMLTIRGVLHVSEFLRKQPSRAASVALEPQGNGRC